MRGRAGAFTGRASVAENAGPATSKRAGRPENGRARAYGDQRAHRRPYPKNFARALAQRWREMSEERVSIKEWLTAAEIAELPGIDASTPQGVNRIAMREGWRKQQASGRGAAWAYHISS